MLTQPQWSKALENHEKRRSREIPNNFDLSVRAAAIEQAIVGTALKVVSTTERAPMQIFLKKLFAYGTLLGFFLAASSLAQVRVGRGEVGGWQHLGDAHVDGRADHDRINVNGGAFTAFSLGVSNGAVGFDRLVVHFRNGGEEVLPVRTVMRSGGRTPAIPLRGGAREISEVEIWYQKGQYNEGKPRVDLFGRH